MDRIGYIIAILLAIFGLTAGAVLYALLEQYPPSSPQREWLLIAFILVAVLCVGNIALLLVQAFSDPKKYAQRRKMEPTVWINLGLCLIVFGAVRHFSEGPAAADNNYLYFDVDIAAEKNSEGAYPARVINKAPSTFFNVDTWFSPEEAKGNADRPDRAYWSLRQLKILLPVLHSGGPRTGTFLPLGYYFVQYNATYKDISYYFRELLQIREYDGSVIQLIDVWKTSPDGLVTKVFTSDRPTALKDDREPF